MLQEKISFSPEQIAGKLLTMQEFPFSPEDVNELVRQSILNKTPSIVTSNGKSVCQRCGNDRSYLFAVFPHSTCKNNTCLYCRNCIMMGRITQCEPLYEGAAVVWPQHADPCRWGGQLTVSQEAAAQRIVSAIEQKSELLVWAVCGAGKTEMLFPGITTALQKGLRIVLATPRTDVVRELLPRFQQAFPQVPIQALYGDSEEKQGDAQLLISTTHQLYRYSRAFDVVIIDEIDAFPYHNDDSLQFAAARAAKTDAARIYLTATPRKKEKSKIRKRKLPAAFIPQRFHGHPLPVPKLKLTPTLKRQLSKGRLPQSLIKTIEIQQKGSRQLLLFVSTITYAGAVKAFLENDFNVDSVHAEDPDRGEKVQRFRDRTIDILVTTTILERGVTFPSVDVFVIDAGHHVFDEAALVQIAGRAGRSPEDPDGDVIFYHFGKTNAMLDAQEAIIHMNKKARKEL
ncbi:DEAD/DEAH box helicase [Halobacillus campisalis]|uniref:DEAD/DEAH box helicase n=1 Tax=Halobacillus campisalis TaxID=435909 RepID=A0ABW2K6U5_9BACI|nr:DEAD/DEAH box helicase [Halobacillus campisalis]